MADDYTGTDKEDTQSDPTENTRRRPSFLLLLAGLTALVVSGWALIGPFTLTPLGADTARWAFVAVAVVVGLALVLSPNRRKK